MKCPKCHYLGFETGDRCRNCGYDFSLLAAIDASPDPDVTLHGADLEHPPVDLPLNVAGRHDQREVAIEPLLVPSPATPSAIELVPERSTTVHRTPATAADAILQAERIDASVSMTDATDSPAEPRSPGVRKFQERSLPLFTPSPDEEDDTPLVRLPPTPRPPLSVRRATDAPRLRAIPRPSPALEPDLEFGEETPSAAASAALRADNPVRPRSAVWDTGPAPLRSGGAVRRLGAACIDYAILLSIDAVVVYFTLRMVNAGLDSWSMLPRVPLVLFLAFIKVGYFGMFTAMGGQTIGKMAARIRVVTEDGHNPGAAQSMTRTLAGGLTALTLGVGFLPALAGEHRALHDRLARTRVITLEPA